MNLLHQFKQVVKEKHLFHEQDKLLLAVSGGVDSVVLCELCQQAGYDFSIAHCNFKLRDQESERDQKFVSDVAAKYQVPLFVMEFDTQEYASEQKLSIQEAARNLRYNWFAELITNHRSQDKGRPVYLLTAHHADDNIETLLMNFTRGTGLNGLAGIPVVSPDGTIRRPLLDFWKDALLSFAKENDLSFVEDSSNSSSKYTRNLFRNEIIPLIGKAYPEVKGNLADNISRFREIRNLYEVSVAAIKKKLCKVKDGEVHIPIKQLLGYNNKALIYEIISEHGFMEKQVDEVIRLSESDSGKYLQSPSSSSRIIKFRNWFIISTSQSGDTGTFIIEEGTKNVRSSIGTLTVEWMPRKAQIPNSPEIACLDSKHIEFPLLMRKWKEGDYFYPLGMRKKKKLSRFFIDQKLSKTDRENIWVIEMNSKILWVIGHRIDERFKITDATVGTLQLAIKR